MFIRSACCGQYGNVWLGMGKKDVLGRNDWLKAGFKALTARGAEALRVEALARGLKVSKGSFYWHFKDLPDLKQAMISHWREVATFAVIADVSDGAPDARAQLRALVAFATGPATDDYGGPEVEAAVRAWGRSAPDVAGVVREVDTVRLAFVTELFLAAGADARQAGAFARMLYAALLGLEQMHGMEATARGVALADLLTLLLGEIG